MSPLALALALALAPALPQEGAGAYPDPPAGEPPVHPVPNATAASEDDMQAYVESIPGTTATFRMVPVPGGRFSMGSPDGEKDREEDEGPQHEVELEPFWMEAHEVTWDEFQPFMLKLDLERRRRGEARTVPQDAWADAVSRPTPPYVPMDFEMGTEGFPAICMTQFAAKQYTRWLSMKTGRFYRLPTEAEWEYACRAGTTTAYSFGDSPDDLDAHAWYFDNADDRYHPVATKAPNPWGLHDMHGNVAEWVLDRYDPDFYATLVDETPASAPVAWPSSVFPRVLRGGSWDDDPEDLRSAKRKQSKKGWQIQDPQLPKSIWYHTNAAFVGFRVVRPLHAPPPEERARYWDADVAVIARVQERQRMGGR
jgi:formylglycine-generating enzyme required for sulfatase activity